MPRAKSSHGLLEHHVERQIIERLRLNGWTCHRLKSERYKGNARRSHEQEEPGTPDWLCVTTWRHGVRVNIEHRPGRNIKWGEEFSTYQVFYLEAKREKGGRIRAAQSIWHDEARKQGWSVCVAASLEEFQQWYEVRYGKLL